MWSKLNGSAAPKLTKGNYLMTSRTIKVYFTVNIVYHLPNSLSYINVTWGIINIFSVEFITNIHGWVWWPQSVGPEIEKGSQEDQKFQGHIWLYSVFNSLGCMRLCQHTHMHIHKF